MALVCPVRTLSALFGSMVATAWAASRCTPTHRARTSTATRSPEQDRNEQPRSRLRFRRLRPAVLRRCDRRRDHGGSLRRQHHDRRKQYLQQRERRVAGPGRRATITATGSNHPRGESSRHRLVAAFLARRHPKVSGRSAGWRGWRRRGRLGRRCARTRRLRCRRT